MRPKDEKISNLPLLAICDANTRRNVLQLLPGMTSKVIFVLMSVLQMISKVEEDVRDRLLLAEPGIRFRTPKGVFTFWNLENAFRLRLESDTTPERVAIVENANLELQKIYLEHWGLDLPFSEQVARVLPENQGDAFVLLKKAAVQHFLSRADSLESALLRYLLLRHPEGPLMELSPG